MSIADCRLSEAGAAAGSGVDFDSGTVGLGVGDTEVVPVAGGAGCAFNALASGVPVSGVKDGSSRGSGAGGGAGTGLEAVTSCTWGAGGV